MSKKFTLTVLVEDDALVRMYGVDIFEEAGFNVLEAGNADDALMILSDGTEVHLVFSDVDMPGSMDGVGLARIVHERWPLIRLLLTSGHHRPLDGDLPESSKFVRKPWTSESLLCQVRNLVQA